MPVRPLAAFRLRPIHKTIVRKVVDTEMITLLTEGEPLSIRAMKRPLRVLKDRGLVDVAKKG
jgi:hypothetical protein